MIRGYRVTTRRLALTALLIGLGPGATAIELAQRQHILIVGSSTTYPIIAAAAERAGRQPTMPTPVVESTGTGGGLKLFCSGIGLSTPDIAMASRGMKQSERSDCAKNGVNDIREIKIGYDGIVFANARGGPRFRLSKRDLYLALAKEVPAPKEPSTLIPNPYRHWHELNPELPNMPIRVLGPPPTSGTRDILAERLLQQACLEFRLLRNLQQRDPYAFAQSCQALREDGAFVNAGENDARLVRKLLDDPAALGVLGYNFLDRNRDRLQAASVGGIEPLFDLIESGVYPLSRPLYLYVKPGHARLLPSLPAFVDALVSPEASGPQGYLIDQGLIPLPAERRAAPPN